MSESDDDDRILNELLDKQNVHGDENDFLEELPEPAEVSVLLLSI